MKLLLPLIALFVAGAASAHSGGHLHPHGANSWAFLVLLLPASLGLGYVLGRVHK